MFVIVGSASPIQTCECHVYNFVDQYWEKLENLPMMQSALPFPTATSIDRGEDSYLYVSSNDAMAHAHQIMVPMAIRIYRKAVG